MSIDKSIDQHLENREWTFTALDELQAFTDDPDFQGDKEGEANAIERRRTELRDGKYRVVFLGAFNVGKSTLINALLAGEYLPTVLEECTTKITHVLKGESMRTVINLHDAATEDEIRALNAMLDSSGIQARVVRVSESEDLVIEYTEAAPAELRESLKALVTVNADDDFPQLTSLRGKFEEIFVYLPSDKLMEDIAFVDSPGVHSISETNRRIAQEIIPHSHLVVCLLDSQHAGNEHNSAFIEHIVRHRHRKMFFVINKSDQLNEDEIDLEGRRGPAKDLYRSLEGVVPEMELFFVSSLYALMGELLRDKHIALADIDQNNKIKIGYEALREMMQSEDPEAKAGQHLIERSNFEELRTRLLDYLYTENREGAILESVCRFVDGRAWKYMRPLEVKLELVRNVPKLDYLKRRREQLTKELETKRGAAAETLAAYDKMTTGGDVDAVHYDGYAQLVDKLVGGEAVTKELVQPLEAWINDDEHLKHAKRNEFKPLRAELESNLETFLGNVHAVLNREVQGIESRIIERTRDALGEVKAIDRPNIDVERPELPAIKAGLSGSYAGFGGLGLVLGAGIGAAAGAAFLDPAMLAGALGEPMAGWPQLHLIAGSAAGGAIGLLLGFGARMVTSLEALRARVREEASAVLRRMFAGAPGAAEDAEALCAKLKAVLAERRASFSAAVRKAFDDAEKGLQQKINAIQTEEDKIRRTQQEIIERIEPKVERLRNLHKRAREVVEAAGLTPQQTDSSESETWDDRQQIKSAPALADEQHEPENGHETEVHGPENEKSQTAPVSS